MTLHKNNHAWDSGSFWGPEAAAEQKAAEAAGEQEAAAEQNAVEAASEQEVAAEHDAAVPELKQDVI